VVVETIAPLTSVTGVVNVDAPLATTIACTDVALVRTNEYDPALSRDVDVTPCPLISAPVAPFISPHARMVRPNGPLEKLP
jgi:hypothetical protein